ncbi:hypothetical protein CR513_54635, partial [Mucuna pruriens]
MTGLGRHKLIHPINIDMVQLFYPREFNRERVQRGNPESPGWKNWEGERVSPSENLATLPPCHDETHAKLSLKEGFALVTKSLCNAHTS